MLTSLIAIFLTVLVFLGSLRASCIVIFCVAATIIQVRVVRLSLVQIHPDTVL